MVKVAKRRKHAAAAAAPSKAPVPAAAAVAAASVRSNPFEVKVNRQKFHILGRKTKHDVGLPGVMRSKAHKKRTQTLLKEYKEKEKSNVFKDKRFGEYDTKISPEEKMMKRFALEQQKKYEKKDIYNLNEEEDLTHYGHSLANIEKFDDIVNSDSDTEERGILSADLTATHFGGGGLLRKKTSIEQQDEENKKKSRKELIEELIAKSKQEKRERQTQRENTEELTEKLNTEWKEIQELLFHKTSKSQTQNQMEEKPKPDEYDIIVRELGFEMKVLPSNRMKTEEELAKEEQERLQQLEADRIRRMHGKDEPEVKKSGKHISADDLADGFLLDKDDRHFLSYKVLFCQNFQPYYVKVYQMFFFITIAPESYEQLKALLLERSIDEQLLVIERIQKSNHPSLAVGNKAKLEKLFEFLLEYVGELARKEPPDLKTIDKLIPTLYDLCQMFPKAAADNIKFILQDAVHEMEKIQEVKSHALFPGLDMLIYLKIIALLFPTSDFWHPVVTPSLVYMSQLLTKCPVTTVQDVMKGLFICCLFLEYISLSQRFVPELLNFLLKILHMATPKKEVQGLTLVHPFASLGKQSDVLVVCDKADIETWQKQRFSLHIMTSSTENNRTEVNHLRLSCLSLCLELVKKCAVLYGSLSSFLEIVQPFIKLLSTDVSLMYPPQLQELCENVLKQLKAQGQYCPLVCEKKKPVPLKLFTPKIVKVLEFGRKQESNKKEQERKRLIHKHKRELKGAVREIRKDNQFLARMQLAEIIDRDSERKRKVKQLFRSLAEQEGDWKAMKKKKF
nr:nucleolar protein 14 [Pogona vitticeps]